jgi:lipopolysaccharide export LptBFGC system permease protein LptF
MIRKTKNNNKKNEYWILYKNQISRDEIEKKKTKSIKNLRPNTLQLKNKNQVWYKN